MLKTVMSRNNTLKNKFFINQFVVCIPDPKRLDHWVEGYVDTISISPEDEILYGIYRDDVERLPEDYADNLLVKESFVFGSRHDMYLWRAEHIKDCIAVMQEQLFQVNQHIKAEEEYAEDCGDEGQERKGGKSR